MFKGVITKEFGAQASAECPASVLISGAALLLKSQAHSEARHPRGRGRSEIRQLLRVTKQPKDENVAVQEQDHIRSRPRSKFRHFNVVLSILIAGWVPSVLMLVVSSHDPDPNSRIQDPARPPDFCPTHRTSRRGRSFPKWRDRLLLPDLPDGCEGSDGARTGSRGQ